MYDVSENSPLRGHALTTWLWIVFTAVTIKRKKKKKKRIYWIHWRKYGWCRVLALNPVALLRRLKWKTLKLCATSSFNSKQANFIYLITFVSVCALFFFFLAKKNCQSPQKERHNWVLIKTEPMQLSSNRNPGSQLTKVTKFLQIYIFKSNFLRNG